MLQGTLCGYDANALTAPITLQFTASLYGFKDNQ